MPNIKLESADGELLEVDIEIVKSFGIIKSMFETLGMNDIEQKVLPLPHVNVAILKMVIEWATYHKENPLPIEDDWNETSYEIASWDANFLKVDHGILIQLIEAANYLDIPGLFVSIAQTIVNMIRGKTPEEIREILNIRNNFNFTPHSEEKEIPEKDG